MLTILIPALVGLIGLLMYAFAANPKLSEIGRLLFFIGAFWAVYQLAGRALHLP